MAEYQRTMRDFLQLQERVMVACLGGDAGRPPAGAHSRWQESEAREPPFDAESDLWAAEGTRQTEPPEAVRDINPAEPDRTPPDVARASVVSANGSPRPSRQELTDLVLQLVEERTGYPRDILGMDQDLESDLGIDSIKRVEIVGAALRALSTSDLPIVPVGEGLNRQRTLAGVVNCLLQHLGSPKSEAGGAKQDAQSVNGPGSAPHINGGAVSAGANGNLTARPNPNGSAFSNWPLFRQATMSAGPRGGRILETTIAFRTESPDPGSNGPPPLASAIALELAAEAAAVVWPKHCVTEVMELRALSEGELVLSAHSRFSLIVVGSEHGDATGFEASVEICGAGDGGRPIYRAVVKLSDGLPPSAGASSEFGAGRASASVRPGTPAERVAGIPSDAAWLFDPRLIESAVEVAGAWRSARDPGRARFGAVRRFAGAGSPERLLLVAQRQKLAGRESVDVLVTDDAGRLLITIDDLELATLPASEGAVGRDNSSAEIGSAVRRQPTNGSGASSRSAKPS
jgi:hypothetical protein